MRLPPLDVIQAWPTPNYVNPPTQSVAILVTNFVFLALCTIAIGLRLYVKARASFVNVWEDVFIGFSYLMTVGMHTCFAIGFLRQGWNRHTWDVRPSTISGELIGYGIINNH